MTSKKFYAPFRVEFDEHGGYDCLSSSYDIVDKTGEKIICVDVDDVIPTGSNWEDQHSENEFARQLAEMICETLNRRSGELDELSTASPR